MKSVKGYLHEDADGLWSAVLDITSNEHYSIFDYKSQKGVVDRAIHIAMVLGCYIDSWKKIGENGKEIAPDE